MEEKKAERKKYTAGNSGKKCPGCMTARKSFVKHFMAHSFFIYTFAHKRQWGRSDHLQGTYKSLWREVDIKYITTKQPPDQVSTSQVKQTPVKICFWGKWIIWSVWLQVILNQGNMHAGSKPTPANNKAIAGRQMTLILFSRQQMTLSPHCKNEQHICIKKRGQVFGSGVCWGTW